MVAVGPLAFEWLAGGLLIVVLGGLIKFAGWTWLLAGYDASTAAIPDEVVRDVAGNTLLRVGIAVFAFGVVASLTDPPTYVSAVFGAVIVLAVARLLYRLNTWSPHTA